MEVRHVDANGLRFAYLEEGTGPLALLLHGFPDTARGWDHLRPRLAAAGFRAVSPWMRGYAPTAIPPRDADLDTLARDVLGLIDALGAPRATVIAHDWGGVAAYLAAALAPARIARLVVIATPHPGAIRPSPITAWRARHLFAYKLRGAPRRFARDDLAALPAICRRWSPTWRPTADDLAPVRACFADPASLDAAFGYYRALRLRLPAPLRAPIEVPTVALAGRDDPTVRPAVLHRAARRFGGGYEVVELPGGHFLHREHPDEAAAAVLARVTPA